MKSKQKLSNEERYRRILIKYVTNTGIRHRILEAFSALQITGVFIIAAAIIAGSWLIGNRVVKTFYIKNGTSQAENFNPKSWEYDASKLDDAKIVASFLSEYLMHRGGQDIARAIKQVEFNGLIQQSGERGRHAFRGQRSQGDVFSLSFIGLSVQPELQREGDVFNQEWEKLMPEVKQAALYLSEFIDPLTKLALRKDQKIIRIRKAHWESMPVLEVTLSPSKEGVKTKLFLDQKALRITGREDHLIDGSVLKYRFDEYQEVEGYEMPFLICINKEKSSTTRISLRKMTSQTWLNPASENQNFAIN